MRIINHFSCSYCLFRPIVDLLFLLNVAERILKVFCCRRVVRCGITASIDYCCSFALRVIKFITFTNNFTERSRAKAKLQRKSRALPQAVVSVAARSIFYIDVGALTRRKMRHFSIRPSRSPRASAQMSCSSGTLSHAPHPPLIPSSAWPPTSLGSPS